MSATPQIPPRPRAQEQDTPAVSGAAPKIPPRPTRRIDRSMSPNGERFAPSPLGNHSNISKTSLHALESVNAASDLRRPPSVSLPGIGQEGSEYEGFEAELGASPTQLRNVANDLKLHAPKPSLPVSSAKQRVAAVTRTDSGQAASYGIGKPNSIDDKDPSSRSLKAKASFASQTSSSTERRQSVDSEHGIPEIGQRVPMYPHAGDVQAPSPGPNAQLYPVGVGFHNDGSKPKHHGRRPSANVPADAYGRYGHGVSNHDRFERAYYEKHPELFKKELGQYGEGRPEWAMSSEDLNKIVRETASRGAGFGTSPAVMSAPSEQLGFQASEEYTSRMSSPRPPVPGFHAAHSNASDIHVDSPLKHEASSLETTSKADIENTLSRSLNAPSSTSLASETEDDIIHVEDPGRRYNKIYGGDNSMQSAEDLGIHTEVQDNGDDYGAPILASDEVAKEPFGWELLPAVSPMHERKSSAYDDAPYHLRSGSQTSQNGSRPSSRPGSIHGNVPNIRLPDGTPLEDLEEYEPLFPEEEKKPAGLEKPFTAADKFKRPELKNRKFPSQDIWEDTPNSLQYTAEVSTPQLPDDAEDSPKARGVETDAQAFARRQEELAEQESRDSGSFLAKEKKPWAYKAHLAAETRPNLNNRKFPSQDIWEDTPESLQLQTTVSSAQSDDQDNMSPLGELPKAGMYLQKAPGASPLGSEESVATKPQIPSRPIKSTLSGSPEISQPTIPDRPQRTRQLESTSQMPVKSKPQVPVRPSKPVSRDSSEDVPLSTVASNSSTKSVSSDSGAAAVANSKPPPPARPMGSKIAALQGGFMADLNKRLQLGAQAPKKEDPAEEKEEEKEKEKAPLVDARKGRARGPARRAPAKSPARTVSEPVESTSPLGFSMPMISWEIDPEDGFVHVSSPSVEKATSIPTKAAESETTTLATNTAGEYLHEPSEIDHGVKDASSLPSAHTDDETREETEDVKKKIVVDEPADEDQEREAIERRVGAPIMPGSFLTPDTLEDEDDLSASTATLKPNEGDE